MSSARLQVDLEALTRNYQRMAAAAQSTAAVVKANAYGCGAGPVARRLLQAGCRDFFVANAVEGRALRSALLEADDSCRIFVFEGARADTASVLAEWSLIPVLNSPVQVDAWRPYAELPVAIQVDTGMQRLGFDERELTAQLLAPLRPVLLLNHYASADDPASAQNAEQAERFRKVCDKLPGVPVSMGNSAATLAPQVQTSGMARAGIALYGGRPFAASGDAPVLEPVAALQGQILQVREAAAGSVAGYGATWTAHRRARLAIVGLGYADGLSRALSNRGAAASGEHRLPIVGRVSMDLVHLDVTDTPVTEGDWVTFFGQAPLLAEVADLMGTIDYEVLTRVGSRVTREYCVLS